MYEVTYIIPIWAKTSKKDIYLSLNSLINESKYICQIIVVHDGRGSFLLDLCEVPRSLDMGDVCVLYFGVHFEAKVFEEV